MLAVSSRPTSSRLLLLLLLLLSVTPPRAPVIALALGETKALDRWEAALCQDPEAMGFGEQIESVAHLVQTVARALDGIGTNTSQGACPATAAPPSSAADPPPSPSLPLPPSPDACAIPDGACGCSSTSSSACSTSSNNKNTIHYLESQRYKVGIDAAAGGGLCHLSLRTPQNSFGGRNLLNAYDKGRYLQQSYYGDEDGSDWNGKPWRWNPVQGGSWQNKPARVLVCGHAQGGRQLSAASQPRNWAGQQLLSDCLMTTAVRFLAEDPHLIHVRMTFVYGAGGRGRAHASRTQEVPAVFVDRRLGLELAFYDGDEPWTGKPLRREKPGSPPPNSYYKTTERFAAWVNENNVGLGVFVPIATGLTAYRVGPDGSDKPSDTSYFALTVERAMVPGETFSYDCYVAAGLMPEIRAAFRRQAVRLGMVKGG